jgi:hypothetical protein
MSKKGRYIGGERWNQEIKEGMRRCERKDEGEDRDRRGR